MSNHAVLSPSSASRWLACTPSARLEALEPYTTSQYADEGTLAHRLADLFINYRLGRILQKDYKKKLALIEKDELYTGEMYDYCEGYAVYVLELFNSLKGAHIFTEEKVDLSSVVPEGFGTVDIRIVAGDKLYIIDFKYGKGVPVFAAQSAQLKLYALGVYEEMKHLFNIKNTSLTIYQPRIDNVNTLEIDVASLLIWQRDYVIPRAKLADEGGGEFVPGTHCQFCKIKPKCKALADYNLKLAKSAFVDADLLTPDEIAEILKKEKFFTDWLTAVSDYAADQAINHGVTWPGMKLVEGRSIRQYINETDVALKLQDAGVKNGDIYKPLAVKGITEMTKALGKADFEKLLSDLVHKPPGKPVLVPETDKRPAYGAAERAKNAFAKE